MVNTVPICKVCKKELSDENWYPSRQEERNYICKECNTERTRAQRKANPEKAKADWTKRSRKMGMRPYNENKECTMYLGVHVAERLLSHVFEDVERMPVHNPGYDFICNRGKKIDVKSSTLHKNRSWEFHISRNTTADYFLCLAFDNRKDLTPLHAWLLPGNKVNHLTGVSISQNTLRKWAVHVLDVSKISACCDVMKE